MNQEEIFQLLDSQNIDYEVSHHQAVYKMAELESIDLPYPEYDAKNLFIRDDKKRNYYLLSIKGDKRIDLKKFRQDQGTRALSFASDKDLYHSLELTPGSVSPFGLLNDADKKVHFYIDKDFVDSDSLIGCHPNDNTATVWLKTSDLIQLIEDHGNPVHAFTV